MSKVEVIKVRPRTPEIARTLWQLQIRNEYTLMIALRKWFGLAIKQIRKDLTEKFIKDITSDLTEWQAIIDQGKVIVKPVILETIRTGGEQAYKILAATETFDVLNVDAIKVIDKITGNMVKEVTKNTKKGIRVIIRQGIKDGKSMDKIARELRPIVGLTDRQAKSVVNYKKWLKKNRPELSVKQVDKKVTVYTNRTHRRRMQVIARTETAQAQNMGYVQGLEELDIHQVEFLVHPDERTCPICMSLNGKRYAMEEGKHVIGVHPNCRCCMLPIVAEKTISKPLR